MATFSVIENTIAVIVMVHMVIETIEGIILGQITERIHIEIIPGKGEGMITIGKSCPFHDYFDLHGEWMRTYLLHIY